ncbi:hypothetical protein ALC62_15553 [Cyphomyrmex costatus]|uniref:Uncharacterized protein n=1 Tax=Cyphomyrmex costatus TaxID=456900 RepID=A0A195C103_9HYME|nr:hypothetical protein ALC62_15553 [Cyphomyrmex costatus]
MASELRALSPLTSQINYNYCETGLHCTAKIIFHCEIFDRYSVGIEVRVTNEIPDISTEPNSVRDAAPPWTTTSAPSQTSPPTPTNPHSQFLSPHVFHGRNSLCSANDYTRRRRPMTLRIGPRLSLPSKSTSAPTTTTDGEWRALRGTFILYIKLLTHLPSAVPQVYTLIFYSIMFVFSYPVVSFGLIIAVSVFVVLDVKNLVHSKSWSLIDAYIIMRIICNQIGKFAQSSIGDRASTRIHAMMMKCDERKREMFSRRACSESGPHPGIPGYSNVPVSGHLWGKRNQGRTSAPVVGHARPPAIILRTRRSWPVAPTHCRSDKCGMSPLIYHVIDKYKKRERMYMCAYTLIRFPFNCLDYIDGSLLKISLRTSKSIFVKIGLRLSIALVSPASFSSYSTRNVISGCNCRVL